MLIALQVAAYTTALTTRHKPERVFYRWRVFGLTRTWGAKMYLVSFAGITKGNGEGRAHVVRRISRTGLRTVTQRYVMTGSTVTFWELM